MKKLTFLILSLFFVFQMKLNAQCGDYPTATHTDPNPVYVKPQLPVAGREFEQNTFDWMGAYSNHDYDYYLQPNQDVHCGGKNPFYDGADHLKNISKSTVSDFSPLDGWELIKQNFGYYYGSGYNGTSGSSCNTSGPATWENGGNLDNNSGPSAGNFTSRLYFVLYNKYSGTLRIFSSLPHLNNDLSNVLKVNLSFLQSSSGTNYSGFSLNGLFNHYNLKALALDKNTTVSEVTALATFPTNYGHFFYADFQLAYDPCVCYFNSGFEVTFETQFTSNFQATGKYAGVSGINFVGSGITNPNGSTSLGNVAGDGSITMDNASANHAKNFIASVFNNGNSPEAVLQSYDNLSELDNHSDNGTTNTIIKDAIDALVLGLDVAGIVMGDPAAGEETKEAVKKGLEIGSKVLEFFGARIKEEPADPQIPDPKPTIMSGYIDLTGTISGGAPISGTEFKIAVPGSKPPAANLTNSGSGKYDEYAPAPNNGGTGTLPDYPMYNEPLGLFALLKTPQVAEFKQMANTAGTEADCTWGTTTNPSHPGIEISICEGCIYKFRNFVFEYEPTSALSYALSPLVDESKSNIYVAYEIEGRPAVGPQSIAYSNVSSLGIKDQLFTSNRGIDQNSGLTLSFQKFRTPFYPVSCNMEIVTKETYFANGSFPCGGATLPASAIQQASLPRKVTLVMLLDLVSKPDEYGKVHRNAQILKYDCDIISASNDFLASGTTGANIINSYVNAGNNLQIPQTTYNNSKDIFSFGTISINGNQQNNSTGEVNIVADTEIDALSEVVLSGEEHLYIQDEPAYFTGCSNEKTFAATNLYEYCTNSNAYAGNQGYQANHASSRLIAMNEVKNNAEVTKANNKSVKSVDQKDVSEVQLLGQDYKIDIFPNPTNNNITLGFFTTSSNIIIVSLEDITGKELINQTFRTETGYSKNQLNMSELTNGIYFIKISDEKGKPIKTDKIVLNK